MRGCEQKGNFCENGMFKKTRQTLFVFGWSRKTRILLQLSVFEMFLFSVTIQNHQTLQNRGFSRHKGKPQMALLVSKVPFWVFPFWVFLSKGGFTICATQQLCSAQSTIFIVFSEKHSFAIMKECNLKKTNLPKEGGLFAKTQKGVFCSLVVLFFCCLCFVFCFFVKRPKKGYFLQFSRVFFFFFLISSPKRPVLKCLLSSFSVFFPCFAFVFPFNIPFFAFCP